MKKTNTNNKVNNKTTNTQNNTQNSKNCGRGGKCSGTSNTKDCK